MRRTASILGAGIVIGALAMYLAPSRDEVPSSAVVAIEPGSPTARSSRGEPTAQPVRFLELVTGSVSVSERAALYRLAAESNRATLDSLAAQVAALPDSPGRALGLEILLTRYAEIDARAAVALARRLELAPAALAPVFAVWVRGDASGALQALGDLDAATALALGVALLPTIGHDDLGIARILGAAPQLDPDRFRAEAAVAKAATDPAAALEDALLLPASRSGTALTRIAAAWVRHDVHDAISQFARIDDEDQRNQFRSAVLAEWATVDPEAMLEYVLDLDSDAQADALRRGALQAFALIEPDRALAAADSIPGEIGMMVRRTALMMLARDDPLAAIHHAESLPPGPERDQTLSMVATSYGRTDPEGALAWAQSLQPSSPSVLANVLLGLARVAPERAIDLLFEMTTSNEQQRAMQGIVMNGVLSAAHTASLADRLLATPGRGPALQMLTSMWAQREPQDALRWLLANRERASAAAIAQAGLRLARTDPAAAIGYLPQLPSELRATWISSVADGYAQSDPRGAAAWVAQHRGEAGYDAAVAAIAGRTAGHDPVAAARLFDSIDPNQAPDAPTAATAIAASWARQDPRAAAAWAGDLRLEGVSQTAVGAVAGQWLVRDAPSARAWVLSLPTSAARDAGLVQLLGVSADAGGVEGTLLEAFSSPAAQQRGVSEAVRMIAQRDAAAARQLADRYLTDPGLRQAAERFMEQGSRGMTFGQRAPRLPSAR